MDEKQFVTRAESFGKVVFDRDTFGFRLMNENEYKSFVENNKENIEELDNKPFNGDVLSAPVKLYYDLTSECNLRCKSCHNQSGFAGDDELSTEQALSVVEGVKKDNIFHIKFSGGELTQRPDWDVILTHAKELGLVTSINTNGIYNSKTLEKMISLPLDEINISLDGTKRTNDSIRGSGSYDVITSTISKLHEAGKKVTVNSLITSLTTQEDIEHLLEFGSKNSYSVDFFHVRPMGRAAKNPYLNITFDKLAQMYKTVLENKIKYPQLIHQPKLDGNNEYLINGGTDGFYTFNILPNGDLFAGGCVKYVDPAQTEFMKLGNIIEEGFSVRNVWQNSPILSKLREEYATLQMRCNACFNYKSKCQGFTPEMDLYKQLNKTNPFCKFKGGE
jgi:MoaA/NifB/PqqE/SkfB family radical SAM enzyme